MTLFVQAPDPYGALAARLPEREWSAVRAYLLGGPPAGLPGYVPPGASPLEAARAIGARYPSILEGLRLISDGAYPTDTKPEPPAVERLEAFVVATAHVRFADCKRTEATALLLDGLTMARRVGDDAAQTLVADAIRLDRQAIPLSGCERIRKAAEAYLEGGLRGGARRELALVRLRMRLEAYRWRYGKPAGRLVDAAPVAETLDPAIHAAFAYEIAGSDYRLDDEAKADAPAGRRSVGASEAGTLDD